MRARRGTAKRHGTEKNVLGRKPLTRFYSYRAPYLGLFPAGFAAMLAVTAERLGGPLILRQLVDGAIPARDPGLMLRCAQAYLGLIVVMGVLPYFQTMLIVRLGLKAVTRVKDELFSRLLTLPVSYFDKHPVGWLMARVENDTGRSSSSSARPGSSPRPMCSTS